MIWGYIFIALILAAATYVVVVGDHDARVAILTLIGGSALSVLAVYASGQYFESANGLVASVDFLVLGIFLRQAMTSRRHWTLVLPALQLIVCITHVARLIAPDVIPRIYSAAQGHWSYYQIILVLAAAHMHGVRRKLLRQWALDRKTGRPRDV
jgi:carbon starvation protein CstA